MFLFYSSSFLKFFVSKKFGVKFSKTRKYYKNTSVKIPCKYSVPSNSSFVNKSRESKHSNRLSRKMLYDVIS